MDGKLRETYAFFKSRASLETKIAGWFDLFILSSFSEPSYSRKCVRQAGCWVQCSASQQYIQNWSLFQRTVAGTFLFRGLGGIACNKINFFSVKKNKIEQEIKPKVSSITNFREDSTPSWMGTALTPLPTHSRLSGGSKIIGMLWTDKRPKQHF